MVSITDHQTIKKANNTSIMAWTFVATRGIISKTLPPPRNSSSVDVKMRAGEDKSAARYRDSKTDTPLRDAVSGKALEENVIFRVGGDFDKS